MEELVKEVLEICSYIAEFGSSMAELRENAKKDKLVPNVFFWLNGIDLGPSPKTEKNLFQRKIKGLLSIGVSAVGMIQHAATTGVGVPIDFLNIGKQATAVATTGKHLYKLRAMAQRVRDGGSLARQINFLIEIKSMKLASRGAQLAVACVPVPGVSLLGTGIALAHKYGYAEIYRKAVMVTTAMQIHWRAYRELKVLGAQGAIGGAKGTGPALSLVRELTGTGIDVVGDLHSAAAYNEILLEPAGHLVILFKLQQT